ncbi:uncharacterized protein, partial [Fopius arisanus]|uniref:Uncharacterized protein n=1 Tax=Fopius arisanus TaxID=64838 RepID=A0A9R1TQN8_9HYME
IIYYIDTLEDPDCNIHGLYPSSPRSQPSRSSSICSQIDKPQRYRRSVDVGYPIKQSTGQTGSRPRPKSTRFTPLGDERRASIRKKSPSGRRRSTSGEIRRKSTSRALSTECQIKSKEDESQTETEQMRRHRRVVALVLGIFMFLLVASVVVVVVTLTHSSFHSPPVGNRELARHRAQQNQPHHSEIICTDFQ